MGEDRFKDAPNPGHKGEWSSAGPWLCDKDCPHPRCVAERALESGWFVETEYDEGTDGDMHGYGVLQTRDAAEAVVEALEKAGWLRKKQRETQ